MGWPQEIAEMEAAKQAVVVAEHAYAVGTSFVVAMLLVITGCYIWLLWLAGFGVGCLVIAATVDSCCSLLLLVDVDDCCSGCCKEWRQRSD